MRVFVTGASGFIGSFVVRALLAGGSEVGILAREGNPLTRLQDAASEVTVLRGDFFAPERLRPMLLDWKPEACLHLAWYAEPGRYLHSPLNVPALDASLRLMTVLAEAGCRQIVTAGTCAEYDTAAGFLREDSATKPETIYAAAKLSLRWMGEQVAKAHGMTFAHGRIFYLYGQTEDERRVVPALIKALRNDQRFPATQGEQIRDYLHVSDVAAGFAALVMQQAAGVFNVSSGVPVTIRQLMETVGAIMGKPEWIDFGAVPYRDWDPKFICGDSSKLRSLGWSPRFGLTDGLREVIDAMQAAGA